MKKKRNTGFTLVELLAVMGLLIMMTSLTYMSYINATRGASMKSSVSHLVSSLQLTRQSAIMTGKKTHLVFNQDRAGGQPPYFIICAQGGQAQYAGNYAGGGQTIIDRYAEWEQKLVGGTVYNLENGKSASIKQITTTTNGRMLGVGNYPIWNTPVGPSYPVIYYGYPVYTKRHLAKGIMFNDGGSNSLPDIVSYNSDGTVRLLDYEIKLFEEPRPLLTDPYSLITVAGVSGFVGVQIMNPKD